MAGGPTCFSSKVFFPYLSTIRCVICATCLRVARRDWEAKAGLARNSRREEHPYARRVGGIGASDVLPAATNRRSRIFRVARTSRNKAHPDGLAPLAFPSLFP